MCGSPYRRGAGVGLRRAAFVGGIGAVALAGCAGAVAGCGGSSHTSRPRAAAVVGPVVRVAPKGPPAPLPPGLAALRSGVQGPLAKAGPNSGAAVYDLTTRRSLFVSADGVKRPPASVEKLFTSVAVASDLGPDMQLHTTVLGAGHLGPGGVWLGDLYLRGGGDPTFGDGSFNHVWEQGYGPTAAQLVQQLTAVGIHQVTGSVFGDDSLFDSHPGGPATGLGPDIPDYGGELGALTYDHGSISGNLSPGAFAAKEFAMALNSAQVRAKAAPNTQKAPPGTETLASASSPPMSVLLKLMDQPSDDLFADLLTEQLGLRVNGVGSIASGAGVISQAVVSYGPHPNIVDGSGLSRGDGASPAEVVDLLRAVWRTPVGSLVWNALPVMGVNGTVKMIANGTPAQGRCVAKTGTLDNVTNLAGYCHALGGHVLAFALFLEGPSNADGNNLLRQMVTAIARY